jgi:tetratricopeptide (TPR) repeat protein
MKLKNSLLIKLCLALIFVMAFQPATQGWNTLQNTDPKKNEKINASRDAITHNKKGQVYMQQGYPLHAIGEFKIAIMLNPNSTMSASLYNNLGKAYEMIKEYDYAIMSYEHAIKINPDFALYYKNLIDAYILKKTLSNARKNYEKIVETNPLDARAFFILGLIYWNQNENTRAIEAFSHFIKLEPNVELARAARRYIWELGGNPTS